MPYPHKKIDQSTAGAVSFPEPPDLLLVIGTDASGKDYVANMISNLIVSHGYEVEKRDGWFSGSQTQTVSSEEKSAFSLLAEKGFIFTFALTKYLMPVLLANLIKMDLLRFRKSKRKVIVVSHTAIRLLAFYLGHVFATSDSIILPPYLDRILRKATAATGVKTIVLDIDDPIRKGRISRRIKLGKADHFDLYLAADGILSERVEDILVRLATTYFDAVKIDNNDLAVDDLTDLVLEAFCEFQENRPKFSDSKTSQAGGPGII